MNEENQSAEDRASMAKLHTAARQANAQHFETYSKKQLVSMLTKKFKTSLIGTLVSIEESPFGLLWGHGKPDNELTEQEQQWKEAWNDLRTEILDKGNNQLRAALSELSRYNVKYERYQMNLVVKPRQDQGE